MENTTTTLGADFKKKEVIVDGKKVLLQVFFNKMYFMYSKMFRAGILLDKKNIEL